MTNMEYKPLGKTGLTVSVAGLGCGGNSRLGRGRGASFDESVAIVRTAIDLGVNFLDTAEAYGTEEIVGAAGRNRISDIFLIDPPLSPADRLRLTTPEAAPECLCSSETLRLRCGG